MQYFGHVTRAQKHRNNILERRIDVRKPRIRRRWRCIDDIRDWTWRILTECTVEVGGAIVHDMGRNKQNYITWAWKRPTSLNFLERYNERELLSMSLRWSNSETNVFFKFLYSLNDISQRHFLNDIHQMPEWLQFSLHLIINNVLFCI